MGKIRFLKYIAIIFILFIFSGCVGKSKENELSLLLDWTPNTNHTGFLVALEKGYYEELGIDLKIVHPPEDSALPLLASGKAQFAITAQEVLGTAISSNNLPIKAIATILQQNTSGIISLKEEGIQSFKDLEGKTYATWDLPFEQAILNQVMQDEGADFKKVDLYHSTVTDAFTALQTNVDAIWVYEGWDVALAELMGLDFNFIKFKDTNPVLDFYTPILAANNDFLDKNKEICVKFLKATAKGFEFAAKNPEESAKILTKNYPEINQELAIKSQKYLADKYLAKDQKWGMIDKKRWSDFFRWAYEKEILPKNLKDADFSNEFLIEAYGGEN